MRSRFVSGLTLVALCLTPAAAAPREVQAGHARLRSGPGCHYRVQATLPQGTRVEELERRGDWSRVQTPQASGWVATRCLTDASQAQVGVPGEGPTLQVTSFAAVPPLVLRAPGATRSEGAGAGAALPVTPGLARPTLGQAQPAPAGGAAAPAQAASRTQDATRQLATPVTLIPRGPLGNLAGSLIPAPTGAPAPLPSPAAAAPAPLPSPAAAAPAPLPSPAAAAPARLPAPSPSASPSSGGSGSSALGSALGTVATGLLGSLLGGSGGGGSALQTGAFPLSSLLSGGGGGGGGSSPLSGLISGGSSLLSGLLSGGGGGSSGSSVGGGASSGSSVGGASGSNGGGPSATSGGKQATVTASALNVRTGPGTEYRILGQLKQGESVTWFDGQGDWRRISYMGGYAWVHGSYLSGAGAGGSGSGASGSGASGSGASGSSGGGSAGSTGAGGSVPPLGPTSQAGYVQLPASGADFYGYYSATARWGTPRLVYGIMRVASSFRAQSPGAPRVGVGDISLQNGGPIAGHASHQRGVDADLRAIRTDGRELAVTISDGAYDRARTGALLRTFVAQLSVTNIFFNDQTLIRSIGPVQYWPNHDNHFHVRVN